MNLKLLFDANLSWRLTKLLQDEFPGSQHVDFCGLKVPSRDNEIWDYALKNGFIIATNDEDFYELAVFKGFPPYTILLRTGNQSTKYISDVLKQHKSDILKLAESKEIGVLEIY